MSVAPAVFVLTTEMVVMRPQPDGTVQEERITTEQDIDALGRPVGERREVTDNG